MSRPLRERPGFWLVFAAVFWTALALLIVTRLMCLTAWMRHGIVVARCPVGTPRQTVVLSANGLRRGAPGRVEVGALAHYSWGPADENRTAPVGRTSVELKLLDAKKAELPLPAVEEWERGARQRLHGKLTLPEVPDGDYVLRATVDGPLGESSQDLKLALYAPARIHVITDRPLYEPGNTIQFRAVGLRARDLKPLDGRPGTWVVKDPAGEVVLEEASPAGPWGVTAGSFPLDEGAPTGPWRIAWESGGARDEVTVQVEPFTLPRFTVTTETDKPFYGVNDEPVLRGWVTYSSGAPVLDGTLELSWSSIGAWPIPTEWMKPDGLPRKVTTRPDGGFLLKLPRVPGDLRGQVRLAARITATDPSGDQVQGAASVLLSRDAIEATAVTELEGGLVEGFNNRLFLRVTSPAGRVMAQRNLLVKRAWDPSDPGLKARTDEDGVASLQIDPGPPVNVVIPPMPVRPPPPKVPVRRQGARDLVSESRLRLADQVVLDRLAPRLQRCARFVDSGTVHLSLALRVAGSGRVLDVAVPESGLGGCLAGELSKVRLSSGAERLLSLTYRVEAPDDVPGLAARYSGVPGLPDGLQARVREELLDARRCLPERQASGNLPLAFEWRVAAGSRQVQLAPIRVGRGAPLSAKGLTCLSGSLPRSVQLPKPSAVGSLGVIRLLASASARRERVRPKATTMLGYELDVVLLDETGGEEARTKLRVQPGSVPRVRLRAKPVLARPGDTVSIEILRGPGFVGRLPRFLYLRLPNGKQLKGKLNLDQRAASFEIPAGEHGWLSAEWHGARALVYVLNQQALDVELEPRQRVYAPGQTAEVVIRTRIGGAGAQAAVGLFGVDETLGQLAPLPQPNDMARVRPKVKTPTPAFGALDAQALAMGRIRGSNAAAATVLRVGSIPSPPDLDVSVYSVARGAFDPVEDLTDHFYTVLAELHEQTRVWEREAPKGEQMKPATMAKLWTRALAACQARKENVADAYGRPLRLSKLPPDLLALAGPRAVVIEGTRLPEDVEDWAGWVRRSEP